MEDCGESEKPTQAEKAETKTEEGSGSGGGQEAI